MFERDNFLHSTYSNPRSNLAKIAILKKSIVGYEEHGSGTNVFTVDAENPIEIIMSYDDVKKELTEKIC